ncbi:MAG: T9SS type A sorting domain-containing protein [Bacteroidetes Order II. Incertae sedis bacterium]|nr:T9SS type A sorting domain-containing protein [Bacteroidetes Order II. bacterium]
MKTRHILIVALNLMLCTASTKAQITFPTSTTTAEARVVKNTDLPDLPTTQTQEIDDIETHFHEFNPIIVNAISNILNYGVNVACFQDQNGVKFIIENKNGTKGIYEMKLVNGTYTLALASNVVQPNIAGNLDYEFTDKDGSLVFWDKGQSMFKRMVSTKDANGVVSYSFVDLDSLGINEGIFELNGKKIYFDGNSQKFYDNKDQQGNSLIQFSSILQKFQVIKYTINGVSKDYLVLAGKPLGGSDGMYLMDENGVFAEQNGEKINLIKSFPSIDFTEFNVYKTTKGEMLMAIKEIAFTNGVKEYKWSLLNTSTGQKYEMQYTGTQSTQSAFKEGAPTIVEINGKFYPMFTDGVRTYVYEIPDGSIPSWSPTLTTFVQTLNTTEDAPAKTINLSPLGSNLDLVKLRFTFSPVSLGTLTADAVSNKLTFTPAKDANGTGTITIKHDGLADQTVAITITPVNDAPILGSVTLYNNVTAGISGLLAQIPASDIENDALTATFIGTFDANLFNVSVVGGNVEIRSKTTTPARTYSGKIIVDDGKGGIIEKDVSVEVKEAGLSPTWGNDTSINAMKSALQFINEETTQTYDLKQVLLNISDWTSVRVSINKPNLVTATVKNNGMLEIKIAKGFTGRFDISIQPPSLVTQVIESQSFYATLNESYGRNFYTNTTGIKKVELNTLFPDDAVLNWTLTSKDLFNPNTTKIEGGYLYFAFLPNLTINQGQYLISVFSPKHNSNFGANVNIFYPEIDSPNITNVTLSRTKDNDFDILPLGRGNAGTYPNAFYNWAVKANMISTNDLGKPVPAKLILELRNESFELLERKIIKSDVLDPNRSSEIVSITPADLKKHFSAATKMYPVFGYSVEMTHLGDGVTKIFDDLTFTTATPIPIQAPIANESESPTNFSISGVYPNPFSTIGTVSFSLPQAQTVKIRVYDVLGREVLPLVSLPLGAGHHTHTLDAKLLSAGIYFLHFQAGDLQQIRKFTLQRPKN